MTQRANVRHFPLKSMPLNVTNNYSRYWNWEVSTAVKSANVKLSEKWNEMKVQWFKVHSKAKSRLLTHLPGRPTSTAVEQSKIVRWSKSPCNQSSGKGRSMEERICWRAKNHQYNNIVRHIQSGKESSREWICSWERILWSTKVPGNESSLAISLRGAKVPGSEKARERMGQGAKGPRNESSRERFGQGPIGWFAPGSELARERKGCES